MSGKTILIDQIKNAIFYGVGLQISTLIFGFSGGSGFLFIIGWIIVLGIGIICGLSIINTFIALITFPLSIPLYFVKNTDKLDKLFFDLSTLLGTIVCVSITLVSYQILQQYGLIRLPEFYPFGNLFGIHNFVY